MLANLAHCKEEKIGKTTKASRKALETLDFFFLLSIVCMKFFRSHIKIRIFFFNFFWPLKLHVLTFRSHTRILKLLLLLYIYIKKNLESHVSHL